MRKNPFDHEPHSRELPPEQEIRRRVKVELRKRLRGLRKTTPASACAERSRLIVEHLLAHPAIVAAKSVALFWPIEDRHEVDLRSLDTQLRARSVSLYYPAIDQETGVMVFREVADISVLEEQGLGFAEPPTSCAIAAHLDVIVVPAIGVAPDGHRIGYGAGYYDRALATRMYSTSIVVAYDFQLLAEIPTTEGDVAVDFVVTDRRSLDAKNPG